MPQQNAVSEKKWTEQRVKDELPDVQIEINGKTYTGRLTGRKMPFAVVSTDDYRYDFSWNTIANCLNNQRTLKA